MAGFFVYGERQMLDDILQLPYFHFILAGITGALIAFLRSTLQQYPPTTKERVLDAILCGAGTLSITWLAWRFGTDKFNYKDAIAYAIPLGFLGSGHIFELISKKYLKGATK